jgi:uncharacterized protein YciI
MKLTKSIPGQIEEARRLEKQGQLADAAAIYQKVFSDDPANREVIGRLLILYRKLKEYKKELAVINGAIAAVEQRDKAAQDKWIREHPKAAGAGRSILRQLKLSGDKTAPFGADPVVNAWIKRKTFVMNRISGKKVPRTHKPPPTENKEELKLKKASAARKEATQKRKEAAAARKKEALERKKEAQAALVAKMHPSLFIISLKYLVPLEKIDSTMAQHMAYLDKHYEKGDFLLSGRQIPRTGGIIITRGKDRNAVARIVKEDPFVKKKLARADIIEFSASQAARELRGWLRVVQ